MPASADSETVVSERPVESGKPAALGKLAELEESAGLARWYWNSATKYPR
jgi:hypothetical protein